MTTEEAIKIIYHLRINGSQDNSLYAIGEALSMAISAMERHIPMKASMSPHSDYDDHERRWICPSCLTAITGDPIKNDKYAKMHIYCHSCGQAIDWREE